jgi:hypothetical protein
MPSCDVSNRVLDQPLISDEIAEDAYLLSFPALAGYTICWPEHAALGGRWTPTASNPA